MNSTDIGIVRLLAGHFHQSNVGLLRLTPFPPAYAFCSRRLFKTLWPKTKLFMMSSFSFGHNVFNFILQYSYILFRFFTFLFICFQSRLLRNCCMWERVKFMKLCHVLLLYSFCDSILLLILRGFFIFVSICFLKVVCCRYVIVCWKI